MTVTIYVTDDDVRVRAECGNSEHFTLTPAAFLAARQAGLGPRNTLETFTDWGHARCVVAGRRAKHEFDAATEAYELPESVRLIGGQAAVRAAFIAQRIACSLPAGPWTIRADNGAWQLASARAQAVEMLLPRMLSRGDKEYVSAVLPPLPAFYRALTWLIGRGLAGKGPWAIRSVSKLKLGFGGALQTSGFRLGQILPTGNGGFGYLYLRLLRGLVRTGAGGGAEIRIMPLTATDPRVQACVRAFRSVADSLGDPCTHAGWRVYLPYLENNVAAMLGIVTGAPEVLRRMGSGVAVSYEANSWLSAALFDAAREANWPTIVANHNSHPPTGQAIADFVLRILFHHRVSQPLVTDAAYWSPQAHLWRRSCHGDGKIRVHDYRVGYPPRVPAAGNRPFRILHAGNYQNWSDFFPWVTETADEFVSGVGRLAEVAAGIPGIELTFRIRPKDEVNAAVVRECVPGASNVRVVSTDQDFLEQLAESDLLVAHFSTTIEQALQMGIPVLLWGSAHRYRQFRGRTSPPTAADRSAVYVVAHDTALPAMLTGIRNAHRGAPLTDEEYAQYRFGPNQDDLLGVARGLMASIADSARDDHRKGFCGDPENATERLPPKGTP